VFDAGFTFERDRPGPASRGAWRQAFGAEIDRASEPGAGLAAARLPLHERQADVVK